MVSHYIRNLRSASMITQTWTHLTFLSKVGREPCYPRPVPGDANWWVAMGSPQVEEETGYCLMPKCAVSGNHTQRVKSDTPSPIHWPHCRLFLGACLKSLRPGRLLGASGDRGWALPGPPPTPKLPEAIPGLRVSRSGWEGRRER